MFITSHICTHLQTPCQCINPLCALREVFIVSFMLMNVVLQLVDQILQIYNQNVTKDLHYYLFYFEESWLEKVLTLKEVLAVWYRVFSWVHKLTNLLSAPCTCAAIFWRSSKASCWLWTSSCKCCKTWFQYYLGNHICHSPIFSRCLQQFKPLQFY